ncbi:MAG: ATP-binding protein [Oscillospiraceae bacterium]|nr:ATP-binding protein [Oscillospiraceae bacterium]
MALESISSIMSQMEPKASSSRASSRQMRNEEAEEKTEEEDRYMMSNDPRTERLNPPAPVPCEYCGAMRYTKGINFGNRIIWMPYGPERCTCPEAVAAHEKEEAERLAKEETEHKAEETRKLNEKIRRIIGESGMGERFLRRTFDTFQITEENQGAARTAKRYADSFTDMLPKRGQPEPGRNGLFIAGPKGTGKTHLAAAIANDLIRHGTPVICMTMIDLLERIKRTYARDGVDEGSVLMLYKTVPLLVIDDMGKEPPTEWAVSTVYNIINGRYEAYLPTIVTTNYDDKTLVTRMTPRETRDGITAEATIDRLMEMCCSVVMSGQSWRSK